MGKKFFFHPFLKKKGNLGRVAQNERRDKGFLPFPKISFSLLPNFGNFKANSGSWEEIHRYHWEIILKTLLIMKYQMADFKMPASNPSGTSFIGR